MEIWHHVIFADRDQIPAAMDALGIKYEGGPPHGIGVFDIAESDPAWPEVARLIAEKGIPDTCYTIFTTKEVLSAEWLRVNVTFEQGYPQPETRWKQTTLGLDLGCVKCRSGVVQKASFRIKKEPNLGKRDFMSLFWTAVFFATPRVFEAFEVAGLGGYEKWPVIINSTGRPAEKVAQLYAPVVTEPGLLGTDRLSTEVCKQCGRVKFNVVMRGRPQYRRSALPEGVDFVRSYEWFGSGGFGFQEIFVSSRVARIVVDHGWKGVVLDPLELQ